ncbi:hypothetical protein LQU92_04180 [Kocuria sp. LUK]|uniref:hypothetical protein n=1 Tax=Kocuria sp. LUK TaxID=2897828 RepID=UPI001E35A143|nr:hypothetical protein [Kocuria sp. LUK]MCD1144440.1 hypothetical protein [Kocuria sp. LUK]
MSAVMDRVNAMSVWMDVLPDTPSAGSGFDVDTQYVTFSTYNVAKTRLGDGLLRLAASARISDDPPQAKYGTHLLALRPALVSAAKGWWLTSSSDSASRAWNACCLLADDRKMGAEAMRRSILHGGPRTFDDIAIAFERVQHRYERDAGDIRQGKPKVPGDTKLIQDMAADIDAYYGSVDAKSDAFLLWNASSSLAHGERWYADLHHSSEHLAQTLTERSFDIVCSGLNLLSQRILHLAATPPTSVDLSGTPVGSPN